MKRDARWIAIKRLGVDRAGLEPATLAVSVLSTSPLRLDVSTFLDNRQL
jgi:hypothetical protein